MRSSFECISNIDMIQTSLQYDKKIDMTDTNQMIDIFDNP